MGIEQLVIFSLASVVLVITPGPDIFHVLARSAGQGMKAGFAAVTGCSAGNLFHTMLAVIGISGILASSPAAFSFLRTAGAVYLIWIGIQLIRKPELSEFNSENSSEGFFKIFRQAAVTNILNPKVGLFFLAFIPQFVPENSDHPSLLFLILGLIFVIITFSGFTLVNLGAGKIHNIIQKKPDYGRKMHRISGAAILMIGINTGIR